jgi:hypothetical protein
MKAMVTLMGTPHFFSARLAALYQLLFSLKISQIFSGDLGGCTVQP